MPERTRTLGDPYHDQCQATARRLADALGRPVEVAFQSRFGRARWLEPATATQLESLSRAGKSVAVPAPGFAAACLATLEDLAIRGKAQFADAGGRQFASLPCLHAAAPGTALLSTPSRHQLARWP